MAFSPELTALVRDEVYSAPYGARTATAAKWAGLLGMDAASVWRIIRPTQARRTRKAEPFRPELEGWTRVVFTVKKTPPPGAGEISTDQAVRLAVRGGMLPPEAADVPDATYNRVARRMGLAVHEERRNRHQAAYPNRRHHFDASSSKFLYVSRRLPDGDFVLKLHRPGAMGYKNKPVPVDRLRPWVYGLVDDYSGRSVIRYVAAQGESVADSLSFLQYGWGLLGLPEDLLCDQGVLKRGLASQDLIARLDVGLPESMPYAKEAHGKIERPWSTLWQRFEKPLFAVGDWEKFTVALSELNRMLLNYLGEYNAMPHRFEPGVSRIEAWERINWRGGVIAIPENALATAARRKKRKVGKDGILEYEGSRYEVLGLHDAWVWVFEGVFTDRLVVQSVETGARYEVRAFKPLDVDEFRAYKDTPHIKAVKEAAVLGLPSDALLYREEAVEREAQAFVKAPARVREEREIDNPLEADVYATTRDAMAEVCSVVGARIPEDLRIQIEALIEQNGRRRVFVADLALDIRAELDIRSEMQEKRTRRASA